MGVSRKRFRCGRAARQPRSPYSLAVVAGLAALLGGCLIAPGRIVLEPAEPAHPPLDAEAALTDVATLVNQHRTRIGCPALRWHATAAGVAQAHSRDMAEHGVFSHEGTDGSNPFDRLRRAGVRYRAAAENIAQGQPSADAVVRAWLRSAGHRRNIENCALTHHGIGVAASVSPFWTHVFLTPQ